MTWNDAEDLIHEMREEAHRRNIADPTGSPFITAPVRLACSEMMKPRMGVHSRGEIGYWISGVEFTRNQFKVILSMFERE